MFSPSLPAFVAMVLAVENTRAPVCCPATGLASQAATIEPQVAPREGGRKRESVCVSVCVWKKKEGGRARGMGKRGKKEKREKRGV